APAEGRLGQEYATGQGVPLDYVASYSWYKLAATAGYAPARKAMADLARIMTSKQLQAAEAQFLSQQVRMRSQQSKPPAMAVGRGDPFNLNLTYGQRVKSGVGVEKLDSSRKEPKFWGSKMS